MRTYGRIIVDGYLVWVEVGPDVNGDNSQIYLTTLLQCLQLVLGEDPFWGNYGLPVQQTIATQTFPDYYVLQLQNQFAQYFANLQITRVSSTNPIYTVNVTFKSGAQFSVNISPVFLQNGDGTIATDGFGNPIVIGQSSGVQVPM